MPSSTTLSQDQTGAAYVGQGPYSVYFYSANPSQNRYPNVNITWNAGSIVGIMIDLDRCEIFFSLNGKVMDDPVFVGFPVDDGYYPVINTYQVTPSCLVVLFCFCFCFCFFKHRRTRRRSLGLCHQPSWPRPPRGGECARET